MSLLGTSVGAARNAYRQLMEQPLYASEERLLVDYES